MSKLLGSEDAALGIEGGGDKGLLGNLMRKAEERWGSGVVEQLSFDLQPADEVKESGII